MSQNNQGQPWVMIRGTGFGPTARWWVIRSGPRVSDGEILIEPLGMTGREQVALRPRARSNVEQFFHCGVFLIATNFHRKLLWLLFSLAITMGDSDE